MAARCSRDEPGDPLLAAQLVVATTTLDGLRLSDPFEQILGARLDSLTDEGLHTDLPTGCGPEAHAPSRSSWRRDRAINQITAKGLAEAIESRLVVDLGAFPWPSHPHELYTEAIEELKLPPERHCACALAKACRRPCTDRLLALGGRVASHRGSCRTPRCGHGQRTDQPGRDDPAALPAGTLRWRRQRRS